MEHNRLWNGRYETRFRTPWDAKPGDLITVTVKVTDIEREALGTHFVTTFTLRAEPEAADETEKPGQIPKPRGNTQPNGTHSRNGTQQSPGLALPTIKEVRKADWNNYNPPFDQFEALHVRNNGVGGYDCLVNVDNAFLINELARAKESDKPLIKFWFIYGLVLSAVGMIKHNFRLEEMKITAAKAHHYDAPIEDDEEEDNLTMVNRYCSGLAQVIIPIIRTLYRGPAE